MGATAGQADGRGVRRQGEWLTVQMSDQVCECLKRIINSALLN